MISLVQERERAKELRKQGFTYSEILKEVQVAKSTLSLWLKNMELTDGERELLKSRSHSNANEGRIKGVASKKTGRPERERTVAQQAEREFEKRRWDPLFLVGVALYWTKGVKGSGQVQLASSDSEIIRVFSLWAQKFLNLKSESLSFKGKRVRIRKSAKLLIKMRVWQKMLASKYI